MADIITKSSEEEFGLPCVANNKLIALFMGANESQFGDYLIFTIHNPQNVGKINHEDIRYHDSWDWLMPVIEKIEGLKSGLYTVIIIGLRCEIGKESRGSIITVAGGRSKIGSVYSAVVFFIRWYHTQINQTTLEL